MEWLNYIITIVAAIIGSTGLFSLVECILQRRDIKNMHNLIALKNDLYIIYRDCANKGYKETWDIERFEDTLNYCEKHENYGSSHTAKILARMFGEIPEKKNEKHEEG